MRNDMAARERAGGSAFREFFIGKGAASGCPFHRFNHRVVEDVKAVWGLGRQAFGRREPLPEQFQKADFAKADPFAMRVQEPGAPEKRLPSEEPSGAGFSIALLRTKMDDLNRQVFLPDAPACEARPAEQPNLSQRAEPAGAHSRNEPLPSSQPPGAQAAAEGIVPLKLPDFNNKTRLTPPAIGAPYESRILVQEQISSPRIAGPLNGCAFIEHPPALRLRRRFNHPISIKEASAAEATHPPKKPETASAPSAAQRGGELNPRPGHPAPAAPVMTAAPAAKMAAVKIIQKAAAREEPRSRIAETGRKKLRQPKAPEAEMKPKKAPAAPLAKSPQPYRKKHQEKPEALIRRRPPASAKEVALPREKGKTPKISHPDDALIVGIKGKKKKNIRTPSRAPSGARAPL